MRTIKQRLGGGSRKQRRRVSSMVQAKQMASGRITKKGVVLSPPKQKKQPNDHRTKKIGWSSLPIAKRRAIIGLLAGAGLSVTGLGAVYAIDRKHAAQMSYTPLLHPEYDKIVEQMGQETARGNMDEVDKRLIIRANNILDYCQQVLKKLKKLKKLQKLQNKVGQGANEQ